MKLDHLRYFVEAATHQGFTAAGHKMHISPTSVGHAVNKLEEQLGTELFIRKPSRGLTLTADGLKLYGQCRQILSDLESVQDRGGEVFKVGKFFSEDYADAVCEKYITLGLYSSYVRIKAEPVQDD